MATTSPLTKKAPAPLILYSALLVCLALAPPSRSFAVQLMGISLFYGFIYQLVKPTRAWELAKRMTPGQRVAVIAVVVGFVLFSGWYLGGYSFHPTWDGVTYWRKTLQFNEGLSKSVLTAFAEMYRTINVLDYNNLLCWVASFPVRLFGQWEQSFFAVIVLFYMPSAFLLTLFVLSKSDEIYDSGTRGGALVFLLLLTMPVLATPSFNGLLDAPAFLMFIAAANAALDKSLIESKSRALIVGFAVVASYLLRRYFVFGAIGLCVASLCYWIGELALLDDAQRLKVFKKLAFACACMLLAAVLTCAVFPGFYYLSLFGGQEDAYASWTVFHGYASKIDNIVKSFGLVWFIVPLLFSIYDGWRLGACGQTHSLKRGISIAVSFFAMAAVSLCLFWRIQDLAPQHFWIIAVPVTSLMAIPLVGFIHFVCEKKSAYLVASGAVAICAVLCLMRGFGLLPLEKGGFVTSTFPRVIREIPVEQDYEQKEDLINYLDSVCSSQTTVFYAAASEDLNSYLSIASGLPASVDPKYRVESADVDSRDGFNPAFFDADYVVTSTPVSIHLDPTNEKVVCELSRLIHDGSSYLGRHYARAVSFDLDNGVTAEVFKRISPIEDDDVNQLEKYFDEAYPQWPELFKDRFEEYRDGLS